MESYEDIANNLFVMNNATVERLFSLGGDAFLLYAFYYKTAKWQRTNEIWATNEYVMKKLDWGLKKVREIKKILEDNGFISQEKQRENGSITAWTIRLKYVQNDPTGAKTPPVAKMTENIEIPTRAKTPPVANERTDIYNNNISKEYNINNRVHPSGRNDADNPQINPPTLEAILAEAALQNSMAGMGGYKMSSEDASAFYEQYGTNGWVRGEYHTPIVNWKIALRGWSRTKEKDRLEKLEKDGIPTGPRPFRDDSKKAQGGNNAAKGNPV